METFSLLGFSRNIFFAFTPSFLGKLLSNQITIFLSNHFKEKFTLFTYYTIYPPIQDEAIKSVPTLPHSLFSYFSL